MYRCTECKAEYKTKVEYCDCGNNTFDYIEDAPVVRNTQLHKNNMSLEKKSELVSRLFFALCLIISILVWLIPVKSNVKPAETPKTKAKPVITKQNIPDIDTIWNNTPAYQDQAKPQNQQDLNAVNLPASVQNNRMANVFQTQTKQNSNSNNKTVVKKNSTKPQQVSKPVEYEIVYNPPPVSKKKETTNPKRNLTTSKPVKPSKPAYNPNSPAMLKYKGNLRAALFSKFAAGSIPGSGSCEIAFSVDKTGKLTNRRFTRESDNKTLNDVVYYMLMSVPKYLPPPEEYNGQTIRMKFVIHNGSYEISIN